MKKFPKDVLKTIWVFSDGICTYRTKFTLHELQGCQTWKVFDTPALLTVHIQVFSCNKYSETSSPYGKSWVLAVSETNASENLLSNIRSQIKPWRVVSWDVNIKRWEGQYILSNMYRIHAINILFYSFSFHMPEKCVTIVRASFNIGITKCCGWMVKSYCFVFGWSHLLISAWILAILTDVYHGFSWSVHAKFRVVPHNRPLSS